MRRRRNSGILVLLIILAFMAFTITAQSITQNRQVRQFANDLLRAYQTRDRNLLQNKYYMNQGLSTYYYVLLNKYTLLGWDITRISGQPYPLNTEGLGPGGSYVFNTINADLYYKPVDNLVQPTGHYKRIKHPKYGDCMVVPVAITYSYHANQNPQWFIKPPETDSDGSWILPFDKPLPGPLDSVIPPQ